MREGLIKHRTAVGPIGAALPASASLEWNLQVAKPHASLRDRHAALRRLIAHL